MAGKICPYCGKETAFVDSSIVYGKSYGMIYICLPCKAYVGVHKGTDTALGRLANAELRELKKQAHLYFDQVWKTGQMERNKAYTWLSQTLNIERDKTHIGMFDEKLCRDCAYFSKQLLNDLRRLDLDFGEEPKTLYYEL